MNSFQAALGKLLLQVGMVIETHEPPAAVLFLSHRRDRFVHKLTNRCVKHVRVDGKVVRRAHDTSDEGTDGDAMRNDHHVVDRRALVTSCPLRTRRGVPVARLREQVVEEVVHARLHVNLALTAHTIR